MRKLFAGETESEGVLLMLTSIRTVASTPLANGTVQHNLRQMSTACHPLLTPESGLTRRLIMQHPVFHELRICATPQRSPTLVHENSRGPGKKRAP